MMLEAIAKQTSCIIPPCPTPEVTPLARWARSGLMALTGPADGAPILASRDICARIAELSYGVAAFARAAGMAVTVIEDVVTARAALLGLSRGGTVSANGTCRMVRATDGWLAVNLPRAGDVDLLPAWIGCDSSDDVWAQIESAASVASCDTLVERAQLLGLAAACVGEAFTPTWSISPKGKPGPRKRKRPLVLDMSSLWAGPLCGAILAEAGADVIKLESIARPDGARFGSAPFFAKLNAGKRAAALDLPRERKTLERLFAAADIVIESARPRVLEQWGFSLPEIFAVNPHVIWISVTAYGRSGDRANWVGFGDEVAAAAGLVAERQGRPMFVGDAIADPLTGLASAASAFACLAAGGGFLVDANLFAAAAFVANAPQIEDAASVEMVNGVWALHTGAGVTPVYAPAATPITNAARALGADTTAVLRELLS